MSRDYNRAGSLLFAPSPTTLFPLQKPSRASLSPAVTAATKNAMAAPAFLSQSQPFRPVGGSQQAAYSVPIAAPHPFDRDAIRPVGSGYAPSPLSTSSVLIRRLPLNTSEESLRLMVVFSKELIDVEVLPVEQSDDAGFRSAVLQFKTPAGAQEAKTMLDGKPNISNDAEMLVDMLGASPVSGRRYPAESNGATGPPTNPSSTASSAASSRQAVRFNGAFQPLEKISPPMSSAFSGGDLTNPDSTSHYQNIFSPQSPIGNHLTERPRISGKSLINNDGADDDETGELLKDPVAYAENGALQQQRRATAPQIPISRMATLSLNTTPAAGPASMPPYGHNNMSHPLSSHGSAMSPPVMANGPATMPFNHHHRNHNFPPVNPADQNPPCNTLYVGNLPIDTSEEELKAMFSKQRGYKRLCFRTKQNGPMCFVEFEDVSFATKALHELYGHPLHNSVKGGIRLSFSKNPLGVRSSQNPGQSSPGSLGGGMGGMMTVNGFTTASGPPPGLSAPPGLGMGRLGYSNGNGYSSGGFSGHAAGNPWNAPSYNGAMTAGGPSSMMASGGPNLQPSYMMGR